VSPVDWDAPDWGAPGRNVHVADTGSWLDERAKEE
jgi:hypothetical protein